MAVNFALSATTEFILLTGTLAVCYHIRQMNRPRKVFGRVMTMIEGERWKIEMRKDGLHLRRWHTRSLKHVPFSRLTNLAKGQMTMF